MPPFRSRMHDRSKLEFDVARLFRVAKGEACSYCSLLPEEHGPNGKCLFSDTYYAESRQLRELWEQCERMQKDLDTLRAADIALERVSFGTTSVSVQGTSGPRRSS